MCARACVCACARVCALDLSLTTLSPPSTPSTPSTHFLVSCDQGTFPGATLSLQTTNGETLSSTSIVQSQIDNAVFADRSTQVVRENKRVGNKAFVDEFKRRVDSSWRFSNASDIIPTVPRFLGYRHVDNAMRIEEDGILQIVEDKDVIGEAHFAELFGEELESFLDFEMEELLEKELDLLSSLIDGRALQEHMEENYLRNLIKLAGGLAKLE